MVTDYDCWHEGHADVDIQMVIANLNANSANARELIKRCVKDIANAPRDQAIADASKFAVITAPEKRPPATLAKLKGIIDGL
jgi:5'-methylthioadenosine phosphorylase